MSRTHAKDIYTYIHGTHTNGKKITNEIKHNLPLASECLTSHEPTEPKQEGKAAVTKPWPFTMTWEAPGLCVCVGVFVCVHGLMQSRSKQQRDGVAWESEACVAWKSDSAIPSCVEGKPVGRSWTQLPRCGRFLTVFFGWLLLFFSSGKKGVG